jgi:hypothetical protein
MEAGVPNFPSLALFRKACIIECIDLDAVFKTVCGTEAAVEPIGVSAGPLVQ